MTLFSLLASCSLRFTVLLFFLSDDRLVAVLILPSSRIRYRMMRYRYPVHTVSVAARSRLACFFASSHQLPACSSSYRSSFRRTGRVIVSPCHLPIPFNRIFDVASAACLPSPGTMSILSSSHHLVMLCRPAFPACCASRLSIISFHLIACRLARLLPALRHGWAVRGAGSVMSCLLGSVLWAALISIAGSFRILCGVLLGLLACRLGYWCGRWRSHLVRAGCVAMPCLPLIVSSRLVRRPVCRVGFSFLSPRLATRMGGEVAIAAVLFVLRFDFLPPASSPCACLPRGVSRHPSDTDGGGRLAVSVGSSCGLLACLSRCIRTVPLVSSFPFHGLFDWCGSVPSPDVVGMSSGAVMPCRASSRPSRLPVA